MRERALSRGVTAQAEGPPDPRLAFVRWTPRGDGAVDVFELHWNPAVNRMTAWRRIGVKPADRGRLFVAADCPEELRSLVHAIGQFLIPREARHG